MSYLDPNAATLRSAEATLALRNLCASLASLARCPGPNGEPSLALRLYRDAWNRLLAGEAARATMLATLGEALAATRLGDLDPARLAGLGVAAPAASQARLRALAAAAAPVETELRTALRLHVAQPAPDEALPACLAQQADRPPGMTKGESAAERSLRLALLAALLASDVRAEAAEVFLVGLAHGLPAELPGVPAALQAALRLAQVAAADPASAGGRALVLALAGGPALQPMSLR